MSSRGRRPLDNGSDSDDDDDDGIFVSGPHHPTAKRSRPAAPGSRDDDPERIAFVLRVRHLPATECLRQRRRSQQTLHPLASVPRVAPSATLQPSEASVSVKTYGPSAPVAAAAARPSRPPPEARPLPSAAASSSSSSSPPSPPSYSCEAGFYLLQVPMLPGAAGGRATAENGARNVSPEAGYARLCAPIAQFIEPGFTRALFTAACFDALTLAGMVPPLLYSGADQCRAPGGSGKREMETDDIRTPEAAAAAAYACDRASDAAFAAATAAGNGRARIPSQSHMQYSTPLPLPEPLARAREAHAAMVSRAVNGSDASEAAGDLASVIRNTALTHCGVPIDFVVHGSIPSGATPQEVSLLFGPRARVTGASMLTQYACMHAKLGILWYPTGIRVIISTANLVPNELMCKTQGVWAQDFPFKEVVHAVAGVGGYDTELDNTQPSTRTRAVAAAQSLDTPRERALDSLSQRFGRDLQRFLLALADSCGPVLATRLDQQDNDTNNARLRLTARALSLDRVDFRAARACLVPTIPGSFPLPPPAPLPLPAGAGAGIGFATAQLRVRHILSVACLGLDSWAHARGLVPSEGVVCQASSTGNSLTQKWLGALCEALVAGAGAGSEVSHDNKAAKAGKKVTKKAALEALTSAAAALYSRLQLAWPSVSTVRGSVEGLAAGPWLLMDLRARDSALWQRLAVWDASKTGRQGAVPHLKSYARMLKQVDQHQHQWWADEITTTSSNLAGSRGSMSASAADAAARAHGYTPVNSSSSNKGSGSVGTALVHTIVTSANMSMSAWGSIVVPKGGTSWGPPTGYKASDNDSTFWRQTGWALKAAKESTASVTGAKASLGEDNGARIDVGAIVGPPPACTAPIQGEPQALSSQHFELGVLLSPVVDARRRELLADGRLPPVLETYRVSQGTLAAVARGVARGVGAQVGSETLRKLRLRGLGTVGTGAGAAGNVVGDIASNADAGTGPLAAAAASRAAAAATAAAASSASAASSSVDECIVPMPALTRSTRPRVDVMLLQPRPNAPLRGLRRPVVLDEGGVLPVFAWWRDYARGQKQQQSLPPPPSFDAEDNSTPSEPRAVVRVALLAPLPHTLNPVPYDSPQAGGQVPWTNDCMGQR